VLYPRKLVSLRTGTSQAGAAGTITLDASASAVDDYYNGCLIVAVLDGATEARIITDYVGSTKVASVTPNWNTTPDSDDTFTVYLPEGRQIGQADPVAWNGTTVGTVHTAGYPVVTVKDGTGTGEIDTTSGGVLVAAFANNALTAAAINADAFTAAKFAADVTTEFQNGLATAAAVATLQTSVDDLPTNAELATSQAAADDATLAAIAALNNLSAAQVNAEVDTAIADAALATAANLATVAGYIDTEVASILAAVDTEVAAIKAKTDSLTFTVAGQVDVNLQYVNDVQVTGAGTTANPWYS
jgi:hypothetical protein